MEPADIIDAVGTVFMAGFLALLIGKVFTTFVGAKNAAEQSAYDKTAIGALLGIFGFAFAVSALGDPDKGFVAKMPEASLCFIVAIIGARLFTMGYKRIPKERFISENQRPENQPQIEKKWWMIDDPE